MNVDLHFALTIGKDRPPGFDTPIIQHGVMNRVKSYHKTGQNNTISHVDVTCQYSPKELAYTHYAPLCTPVSKLANSVDGDCVRVMMLNIHVLLYLPYQNSTPQTVYIMSHPCPSHS